MERRFGGYALIKVIIIVGHFLPENRSHKHISKISQISFKRDLSIHLDKLWWRERKGNPNCTNGVKGTAKSGVPYRSIHSWIVH